MPRVCEFYGIQIYVYYDDHDDPHFHAAYAGREVQVRIDDLSIMAGRLPPRAMGLVVEWAAQRRAALREDWQLAREHRPLKPIAPPEVASATMLRITRAAALDGHRLRLTLTNGDIVERDIGALLWGPVFEPLRQDEGLFRAVSVRAGTVAWPGDVDLDPDVLIWGGPEPGDPAARPPRVLRLERTASVGTA